MKRFWQISVISLVAVGLFFGRTIGNFIVDKLDNKDTRVNNGKIYADKYIEGCDTLTLTIKNYKDSVGYFKVKGTNGSQADVNTESLLFYVDKYKKYFEIMFFFNGGMEDQEFTHYTNNIDQKGDTLLATVNLSELKDPGYGTIQKPVPILYFYCPTHEYKSFYDVIKTNDDKYNGDETKYKSFRLNYNASHYLSYVKSKQDFQKMFGQSKQE